MTKLLFNELYFIFNYPKFCLSEPPSGPINLNSRSSAVYINLSLDLLLAVFKHLIRNSGKTHTHTHNRHTQASQKHTYIQPHTQTLNVFF